MKRKLFVIVRTLITLVVLISLMSSTAYASKRLSATSITYPCSGGTTVPCSGPTYTQSRTFGCSCGASKATQTVTMCSGCGRQISSTSYAYNCPSCVQSGSGPTMSGSHGTKTQPCSHGYTSSHSVSTGEYQNTSYGYRGTSSTFTGYTIGYTLPSGVTVTSTKASGATATDYFVAGKTITTTLTNTTGCSLAITVGSDTQEIAKDATSFTFTMPAADTTVVIELAKQPQTISVSPTSYSKIYNHSPFKLSATVS